MSPPPPLGNPRYQQAQHILATLISHYTRLIGQELARSTPNPDVLRSARHARTELNALRDGLEPQDSQQIDTILAEYGPLAASLDS